MKYVKVTITAQKKLNIYLIIYQLQSQKFKL